MADDDTGAEGLTQDQLAALSEAATEAAAEGGESGSPGELAVLLAQQLNDQPTVERLVKELKPEELAAGCLKAVDYTKKTQQVAAERKAVEKERQEAAALKATLEERERELKARGDEIDSENKSLLEWLAGKDPKTTLGELFGEEHMDDEARETVTRPPPQADKEVAALRDKVAAIERKSWQTDVRRDIEAILDESQDLVPSAKDTDPEHQQLRNSLREDIYNRYLLSDAPTAGQGVDKTARAVLAERRIAQKHTLAVLAERHKANKAKGRREGSAGAAASPDRGSYVESESEREFTDGLVADALAQLAAAEED